MKNLIHIMLAASCILFYSCNANKFNINLENDDYDLIYTLMKEIDEKAKNNDSEYFRQAFNYEEGYFNEDEELSNWFVESLKYLYKKENYSNDEIIEYHTIKSIEILMESIIKANIIKTYKNRAVYSNKGINFNYHWTKKDVHFQMYIIKYWDEYSELNADNYDPSGKWRLYSIWKCR